MNRFIADRFQHMPAGLTLDTRTLSRFEDAIDLSIGDTDFITDERIIEAAFLDAKRGYTHYGDPKGDPELIDAICRAWQEDFGQAVEPEEVLITASSCLGMAQVLLSLLNPGDEVLVFGPYFAVYRQQIELAGGKAVEVKTQESEDYCPKRSDILAALTEHTRAMIVNTPSNPTGAVYPTETLNMLADIARQHDLLVIADEIYTRYQFEGDFIPMRTLPGMKDRTVTLNSFSKNFMMTGWRVGCILAHPELISVFKSVNGGLIYTAPAISQRAALKALSIRQEIAERFVSVYQKRVLLMADHLQDLPYLTLFRPRGTFYLFPGIAKTGLDDAAFCSLLLEKAHILVSGGSAFGEAGKDHFRIACTVPQQKLEEAAERMKKLSGIFTRYA